MTPDEIKLGRVGHYSYQNVCQTASIVFVIDRPNDLVQLRVNVAGWTHDGDAFRRSDVPVGPIEGDQEEFHLNRDCPRSL